MQKKIINFADKRKQIKQIMKKQSLTLSIAALAFCCTINSCGPSAEEQSEQVAKKLFSYINESENDSIENVFPNFDSGNFGIIYSDSIRIKEIAKDEENKDCYVVKLVNYYSETNDEDDIEETDVTLWTKKGEKKFLITESVGLINRSTLPYYVRACGALKSGGDDLKDSEILKRAEISKKVLHEKAEKVAEEMKDMLKVSSFDNPGGSAHTHHTYIRVKNNSPYPVYKFTVKQAFYDKNDNTGLTTIVRTISQYIPAFTNSGTITLTWNWDELHTYKNSVRIGQGSSSVTVTPEDLITFAELNFDGTEYKSYVKKHKSELEEEEEDDDDED